MPTIAQPLPYTHLSVYRYAQLLGINPVHFNGGVGPNSETVRVWPLVSNACLDVWTRDSWQSADAVSHMSLAHTIKEVEDDISKFLGYPLCPAWVSQEMTNYPRFHRPEYWSTSGLNVHGAWKTVKAKWAKVIEAGRRAVTAVELDAAIVYSDEDSDGYDETATITAATALLDPNEIKIYFEGTLGNIKWEIRPLRSVTISGGVVTIVLDAWLLFDPDLLAYAPTQEGVTALNIETAGNYVTTVDIYREFTDRDTDPSSEFFWRPQKTTAGLPFGNGGGCIVCSGTGCPACDYITQDGCLQVADPEVGLLTPIPAAFNSDTGVWNEQSFVECREPSLVKVYYKAGLLSDDWLNGYQRDPLDEAMARIIAMMVTARLERPLCGCSNVTALSDHWQEDVAFTGDDSSYLVDFGMLRNAFGTKYGEMNAWRKLAMIHQKVYTAAVI